MGLYFFIMGTTRREHFEKLPADLRAEVYKNIANDPLNRQLNATLDTVLNEETEEYEALLGAFTWNVNGEMSQVEYWSDINGKYFGNE